MKIFSEVLTSTEERVSGLSGEQKGTKNDNCGSVFQKISTSAKRRMERSMFAVTEASDDYISYTGMHESIKSTRDRPKVDLLKSSKLSLSVLNEFILANETSGLKFVRSLAGDGDMNPTSLIHASKRNGAKLEILSDDDDEIESNYERADANPERTNLRIQCLLRYTLKTQTMKVNISKLLVCKSSYAETCSNPPAQPTKKSLGDEHQENF